MTSQRAPCLKWCDIVTVRQHWCVLWHDAAALGVPPTTSQSPPTFRQLKSCRLHSLQVPSADDVASTWSTGEKQTAQTPRRWPRNTPSRLRSVPPASDHSLAVRSWEPDASSLSLGDTATLLMSCGEEIERCDRGCRRQIVAIRPTHVRISRSERASKLISE